MSVLRSPETPRTGLKSLLPLLRSTTSVVVRGGSAKLRAGDATCALKRANWRKMQLFCFPEQLPPPQGKKKCSHKIKFVTKLVASSGFGTQ